MHTSSGVDNIDEYAKTVTRRTRPTTTGTEGRHSAGGIPDHGAVQERRGMASKVFTVYRTRMGRSCGRPAASG
jgi:hypothetical protein